MSALRIDVHAHLWTVDYLDRLERLGKTDTGTQRELGADATAADLDHRFALMDRAGIALHEVIRAFDDLGAVGVGVTTTVLGRTLADPLFHPLYEELDRRGAVLCIHPSGEGAASPLITEHDMTWMVGAPVEDTVAIMHLILAGLPARYPRMRILASHLGGALPLLPRRLDDHLAFESPRTPELPSVAVGRLWYDTVSHVHGPALAAAAASFGAGRLVLGTDFPYEDDEVFVRSVDYVCESGLTQEEATAILDTNAADLLGLSGA
ncbi:amidohydrolase family protein [Streptomyces sp. NPDC056400]|uniref:amidohydrolase family protein n=1 Tax=Streptomyces sp. NPDC056400 TaxID=3345808 RepID=UPI0035E1A8DE